MQARATNSLWARFNPLFERHDSQVLLVLGAIVGIGAGLGAVFFRTLVTAFTHLFFVAIAGKFSSSGMGNVGIILLPALGGAVVGPLIYLFAREAKGHGVPEVMLAIHSGGGRIRPRVAVVKALASSICIGSGGSVGREGPIVQIGAALGSTFGQILRLPPETTKLLVACGCAGGVAATFNAPIAGVFFALEVILRSFSLRNFSVVVLGAVVAAAISQALLGTAPAFPIPPYALKHAAVELPLYALLGVLSALAGIVFMEVLYAFEDVFDAVRLPEYVKPISGGLAVGALGLWHAEVFGVGYDGITAVLAEHTDLTVMLLLVVLKIAATSFTLGSGGSGGVFAPSLFIGSMFGGAFGLVVHGILPGSTASYGAYATVGMGAVFAGTARAPITAVLILFEMTRDYSMILPLMTAVVVSAMTGQLLHRESIYTAKLKRRGIDILATEDQSIMSNIRVNQAMDVNNITVREDLDTAALADRFHTSHRNGFPVVSATGELVGIVTQSDLERIEGREMRSVRAAEIATQHVVTIYPDETLDAAIRRMDIGDLHQLVVVSRAPGTEVIGLLSRGDIMAAYSRTSGSAAARVPSLQTGAVPTRAAEFVEIRVRRSSPAVGQHVRDLPIPSGTSLVHIMRHGHEVIPRGDDVIWAGDLITAIGLRGAVHDLERALGGDRTTPPRPTSRARATVIRVKSKLSSHR